MSVACRNRETANLALLALILFVALSVHLPVAIDDLPFIHHPDEPTNLGVLHRMMAEDNANPKFFNYPSVFFYLNAPGQYLAKSISDVPIELDIQAMGSAHAPAPEAIIFARATSMIVHLMTVASVFLFLLPRVGSALSCSAALLAALSPLTTSYAVWAAPDVFAALFVTLCLIATVRIVETGRTSAFIIAGILAGLAASTKYNAGFVAVSIAAAAAVAPGAVHERARLLARAALLSILALLAGSPYLLLDINSAVSGILFELHHYRSGHIGAEGNALENNAKWLLAGLGIATVLTLPALQRREMWPVFVFVVGYFLFLSHQMVRFERNLAPLAPAVAILAAVSASDLIKAVVTSQRFPRATTLAVSVLIALPVAWKVTHQFGAESAAPSAERAWLESVIPSDARVIVEAYTPYLQPEDRNISAVSFAFRGEWSGSSPSHLVLSRGASQRFRDDPRTMSEYAEWVEALELEACDVTTFAQEASWRVKVFTFECFNAEETN